MALNHLGHNLWFARAPTPARDGSRVYLLCSCGRPRLVAAAEWQAELARRAAAEADQRAHAQQRADEQAAWERRQTGEG